MVLYPAIIIPDPEPPVKTKCIPKIPKKDGTQNIQMESSQVYPEELPPIWTKVARKRKLPDKKKKWESSSKMGRQKIVDTSWVQRMISQQKANTEPMKESLNGISVQVTKKEKECEQNERTKEEMNETRGSDDIREITDTNAEFGEKQYEASKQEKKSGNETQEIVANDLTDAIGNKKIIEPVYGPSNSTNVQTKSISSLPCDKLEEKPAIESLQDITNEQDPSNHSDLHNQGSFRPRKLSYALKKNKKSAILQTLSRMSSQIEEKDLKSVKSLEQLTGKPLIEVLLSNQVESYRVDNPIVSDT